MNYKITILVYFNYIFNKKVFSLYLVNDYVMCFDFNRYLISYLHLINLCYVDDNFVCHLNYRVYVRVIIFLHLVEKNFFDFFIR